MESKSTAVELTSVFARIQDMLLSQEQAAVAVHQLAQVAQDLIPSSAGAGVSLIDTDGARTSTGSTDDLVEAADALQYELGEGPCLSAWATATLQRSNDTTDEDRWPQWSAAAAALGIRSILSVPLVFQGRCLGAMKVYATVDNAFTGHEEQQLGLLAAVAATLLGAAQTREAPQKLSAALQSGLGDRQAIDRATGMLMEQRATDPDDAHAVLITASLAQGRPMVEVARQILQRHPDPDG
ncbi:GAF domain-containing protein [Kocuria sediminis]|uniref:GAF domain-containing protein n=1 Tax=Kocuria sediminis TaxID=1038857 RepID=A0A6N8GQ60_9MICC|nr:GAF and ANTAR domain-containing protein [Kocuria sediminis]MUN64919.1 GAF domain-containing protein [Kocuria sediminis]